MVFGILFIYLFVLRPKAFTDIDTDFPKGWNFFITISLVDELVCTTVFLSANVGLAKEKAENAKHSLPFPFGGVTDS